MSYFEVRDENGVAMVATEDYTQAVNSALVRGGRCVVKVSVNCGSYDDVKTVWKR